MCGGSEVLSGPFEVRNGTRKAKACCVIGSVRPLIHAKFHAALSFVGGAVSFLGQVGRVM
jgi:hypothetical protein